MSAKEKPPTAMQRIEQLDGATPRLAKLVAALEGNIARLRAPIPQPAARPASPREVAARLQRLRQQLRDAEKTLDEMAKQARSHADNADEWERRAMLAVMAGDDDLARDALRRRTEEAIPRERLEREIATGRAVLAEMRAALDHVEQAGGDPPKR